jgi:hypothetical protein
MWHLKTNQAKPVAFRVNIPLIAVTKDSVANTVIPAGSVVEWQPGDFCGGVATVFWLRRPVVVMEAELFKQCERMGQGISV